MCVMGIDVSTCTGVAIATPDKQVAYAEEIQFKKERGWNRANAIMSRIMDLHSEHKPSLVVLEGYGYANAHSLVTLVEIGTIIRYMLWQEGVKYIDVPPNSLKSFVTGKGTAKKDEVMMFVLKNWGYESKTNNIADAVGLAMFGLCVQGVKFSAGAHKAVANVMVKQ